MKYICDNVNTKGKVYPSIFGLPSGPDHGFLSIRSNIRKIRLYADPSVPTVYKKLIQRSFPHLNI